MKNSGNKKSPLIIRRIAGSIVLIAMTIISMKARERPESNLSFFPNKNIGPLNWFNINSTEGTGCESWIFVKHCLIAKATPFISYSTLILGNPFRGSDLIPIELVKFRGQCNGKNTVLSWSTISETDNDYFTVERSFDGNIWIPAVKVKGAGTSSGLKEYSVTDMGNFETLVYYRLKQTGLDGRSTSCNSLVMANCH
jgi:hypothetical protein